MFHLILYQPEIPPNTGNIIRLCANVGATLHLVHPLGFQMDERRLRRAGLDYHELACVIEHSSLESCVETVQPKRIFALSTKGEKAFFDGEFLPGDAFLFGPETRGLPKDLLASMPSERILRIPLRGGNRSLNLGNAAAVVLYEALRQQGFHGMS